MTAPELPAVDAPDVSVILVTYNAWTWTERALTALRERTPPVYETIVVDNLSTDQTRSQLADLAGARIVLNPANLGFGAAACQGAMLARAPRLLFLNTDAIVEPDWLRPLLETLDASEDIAAVTPRLLNLDGTLQEAGSMVWGDGACDNYGDGDDASRPEYAFRRDTDYASAACLLVRRSAFVDAGGFDDAYHPAYYEDTDLAMRWRAMGLRVVYEPRSTAVHRRWASSGDRSGMVDLLLRNRAVFLERWSTVVGDRPARPATPERADFAAIRDAACAERLLVVEQAATTEAHLAARVAEDLAGVRPGWRVTLVSIDDDVTGPMAERLRGCGVEVIGLREDLVPGYLVERRLHHSAALIGRQVPASITAQVAQRVGPGSLAGIVEDGDCTGAAWARLVSAVVDERSVEADDHSGVPRIHWDGGGPPAVARLQRPLGLLGG